MSFSSKMIVWLAIPSTLLVLCGCGTDPRGYNDHGEAALFRIESVTPDGHNVFQPFDDYGYDGVKANPPTTPSDEGEGNGWPDCIGQESCGTVVPDQLTFVFSNTPRPGIEEFPNLELTGMLVSYTDRDGYSHEDFAPPRYFGFSGTIRPNETLTITQTVDEWGFKVGVFNYLDQFYNYYPYPTPEASLIGPGPFWTWNFEITVFAIDVMTGQEYVATTMKTVYFHLPAAQ